MDISIHLAFTTQVIIAALPTLSAIAWFIIKRKKKNATNNPGNQA